MRRRRRGRERSGRRRWVKSGGDGRERGEGGGRLLIGKGWEENRKEED